MTITNPEIKQRSVKPPFGLGLIDKCNEAAFSEWLKVRQDFVEAQGWKYGDDFDVYDENDNTLHIVSMRDSEINAGLRLTPAENPRDTLSWSMLSPVMQAEAALCLPPDDPATVWDLTRLVTTEGIDKGDAAEAFLEMLGAGMTLSEAAGDNPRWYFTTTYPLFLFFKHQGVAFTPLARGKISEADSFESVFCYADPVERTDWLKGAAEKHGPSYDAVMRGVGMVARGEI